MVISGECPLHQCINCGMVIPVEQSKEEQCTSYCLHSAYCMKDKLPEPKTEDTGECNCIDSFDSATGENCPHYSPEVKTQQGWEKEFFHAFKFELDVKQRDHVKQFISQEIETSKKELIEQIEKQIEDLPTIKHNTLEWVDKEVLQDVLDIFRRT